MKINQINALMKNNFEDFFKNAKINPNSKLIGEQFVVLK